GDDGSGGGVFGRAGDGFLEIGGGSGRLLARGAVFRAAHAGIGAASFAGRLAGGGSAMPQVKAPMLVLVGGFLGAGKTTLILCAARLLARRGVRVGVIMNDQAGGLVDTQFALAQDLAAEEVAGGCFCCRFSDLLTAANRLKEKGAEVIFAEPVG